MKQLLNELFENKTLTRQEARQILINITSQQYHDYMVASFLTIFRMRHLTVEELGGFRDAMQELSIKIDLTEYDPLDVCGTGGDGKSTFNISTTSAFVVAGAGIKVAKHGNYGVSSKCGSSNVIEYLGVKLGNDIGRLKKLLDEANFCYLHAPLFHPAMKHVAGVRKNLGIRTFFNLLGPLVNPCKPTKQMIGVYNLEVARLYNYLLQKENIRYTLVHSLDGYDEISLTGYFKIINDCGEKIFHPNQLDMNILSPTDLKEGEDIPASAQIMKNILSNKCEPEQRYVVMANAAFAIQCYYPQKNITDCLQMAEESIVSGKANQCFQKFIEISN